MGSLARVHPCPILISEAKTNLFKLVALVCRGERVVIAKNNPDYALQMPLVINQKKRFAFLPFLKFYFYSDQKRVIFSLN